MFYGSIAMARAAEAAGQAAAAGAAGEVRRVRTEVEGLEYDVERLLMVTEALWTILKEHHGYDDNELIRRVAEIDVRDGRLDGRLAKQPPPGCPHCNRTLIRRRPFCMYCGKPVATDPFQR
jgi:hypothetical protein